MPSKPTIDTSAEKAGGAADGNGGNQSYAAYNYQIDATIWIGLELMLAKGRTNEIEIEPPSHEDVEATLSDPDRASLDAGATVPGGRLIIQIKSRTTAPWTSKAFAEVLKGAEPKAGGKGKAKGKAKGPAPRIRPLNMLVADKTAKYLFVTNESLESGLRPYQNIELLSFPDPEDLPPYCRQGYTAEAKAEMGRRIGVCPTVTLEILESRIHKLLDEHGNIPPQRWKNCLKELREAVRERLAGEFGGRWSFDDLFAVIVANGGSRLAHRRYDQFVPPKSFSQIEDALRTANAVIIVGPSGTGKTLTADYIAAGLKRASPAYLERFVSNAGEARSALTDAGPLFIHLRDPWGDSMPSADAARWTAELPLLFRMGDVAHKFLVTTRLDIFKQSEPGSDLVSYTVAIEPEDYSDDQREQIYDNHAADLTGHARELAIEHRGAVLSRVRRPYEIERFLAALPRENEDAPRTVHQILDDSSIEAISSVIRAQVLGWGPDGIACAAILWGLLVDGGHCELNELRRLLRILLRDHGLAPHLEGFIDFLTAGRNLRFENERVRLQHPRVEEGLRLALATNRAKTEAVLTASVDALLTMADGADSWASQAAVGIMRRASRLDAVEIELSSPAQAGLDEALAARVAVPTGRGSFERAFSDLAQFATPAFAPRRFSEFLTQLPPRKKGDWPMQTWLPPELSSADIELFRTDPRTVPILRTFIRGVLPFASADYEADFLDFARMFSDDLGGAFGDAVETIAAMHAPGDNIETIVDGAVAAGGPGYELVIDAFIKAEEEAGQWYEEVADEQRAAREHEVDAIQADRIFEEPGERHYNADAGLKAVSKSRIAAEGWGWLAGHKHAASLAYSIASSLDNSRASVESASLRILLDAADDRAAPAIWSVIERNWHEDFRADLESALSRTDIGSKDWRTTLAKLAIRVSPPDGLALLSGIAAAMPASRRLQLVLDLERAERSKAAARAFADSLPTAERDTAHILLDIDGQTDVRALMEGRSPEAGQLIAKLCPDSSSDLAQILVCLAAPGEGDIVGTAGKLLATGDVDDAMPAMSALRIRDGAVERDLIREALAHSRYRVRRAAMAHLVELGDPQDRAALLAMAKDSSADVRLEWARLMRRHRWPEAEPLLAELLEDERDFSLDRYHGTGTSWPRHSVARAAARALAAYDALSGDTLDALIASRQSHDPFVYCAALGALATRDDPRVPDILRSALHEKGLDGNPDYRVTAQAAVWGFFDRAIKGLPLEAEDQMELGGAALHDRDWIAGPALATLGIGGGEFAEALHAELINAGQASRADLLQITAAIFERPFGDHPMAATIVRRLGPSDADEQEAALQQLAPWYDTLPPDGLPTRWLVDACLGLERGDEIEDPRDYRIPETIQVMTLYSMSPYHEEESGPDDGH